jgi:predicted aspartyl protease
MTFSFDRLANSNLIIVGLSLDGRGKFKMILDTGCSNTTIDSSALYLAGYDLKDASGKVEIETANGIVESEIFEIGKVQSLGLVKNNFKIQVYDFMAHGIFSNYDGLLGMDFLEETKFCIDTRSNEITITGI